MSEISQKYLDTLLLYFEEEVMGEAYFKGLSSHFKNPDQKRKMDLIAEIENFTAEAVRPLLGKYNLCPRSKTELDILGKKDIKQDFNWTDLIQEMTAEYPAYIQMFEELENMAPETDRPFLAIMTEHEKVLVEFAELERNQDPDSTQPLLKYLHG